MQLLRPFAGVVTQAFGLPAAGVASFEPAGIFQRDAGGELRRRAYASPPPAGWQNALHYHDGLDIKAPLGTPIIAPADGTIIRCRAVAQAGATDANRYIAIRIAPNVAAYYWHLNDWAASSEGKAVSAGDVIAHVGNTGLSTGPHTHMEVRRLEDVETKYNPGRLFVGGDLEIAADGRIVPIVAIGQSDVKPATDIPVALCDVAAGARVVDAATGAVVIASWSAVNGVGLYSIGGGNAALRIDLGSGGSDLRVVYVDPAKVSNIRLLNAPQTGDVAAAIAKGYGDAKAKAIAALEAL